MGSNHARVISSSGTAQLQGVFDQDVKQANDVATRFGVKSFGSLDEALDNSDALVIATPTSSHVEILKACLAAEKPVCNQSADLEEVLPLVGNKIVMVGHVERFNPAVRYVRSLDLGGIRAISARREGPYSPRITEGVTRDLMIHDIDLCAYLGQERLRVRGASGLATRSKSEDISSAVLEGTSGFVASLYASRIGQSKVRDLRITTDDCLIHLDLLQRNVQIYKQSTATFVDSSLPTYSESLTIQTPILGGFAEPLVAELDCFVESIRQEELLPAAASLHDGVAALDLANLITAG
jgi:predicted dehydrogenase